MLFSEIQGKLKPNQLCIRHWILEIHQELFMHHLAITTICLYCFYILAEFAKPTHFIAIPWLDYYWLQVTD